MSKKPMIMVVDDEPASLATLVSAIERRYGSDYEVVGHLAPRAALADLERRKAEGSTLALCVADQWMPDVTGLELLGRAHQIEPAAQRALLVAWGDRRAAPAILEGCTFDQLDNYIYKPWVPAEIHLYPALSEFLSDFARTSGPRMELVRLVGEEHSPRAAEIRELLARSGVPHGCYIADTEEGKKLLGEVGLDGARLPALVLLDGTALIEPDNREIASALGTAELVDDRVWDLAIVGAGPAGLAAAVYAASEGLSTLVIEREVVGGQAGTSSLIRNYLGFPRGISGAELAQRAYQQAWLFGAKYLLARGVSGLRPDGDDRVLVLSEGGAVAAHAVLIATGASYRRLDLPAVDRFVGAGLFYAAVGDTRTMRGRDVCVIGGGNAAGQAVVHLAKAARNVTLLVRGPALERSMSDYLIRQIRHLPNVQVRLDAEVVGGDGDRVLREIAVRDRRSGAVDTLRSDMVFVLIGAQPHTDWLAGTVERDPKGYVLTGEDVPRSATYNVGFAPLRFETSLSGVFAAGDVRYGSVKRVASAVGEGSVAVRYVHDHLRRAGRGARPRVRAPVQALPPIIDPGAVP